jgi:adenylate kinase family enzyme
MKSKLARGYFFIGMRGFGKTTLSNKLYQILKVYNFKLISENFREIKYDVHSLNSTNFTKKKEDIIINNKIKELIKNHSKFISDSIPFHCSYIGNMCTYLETRKFDEIIKLYLEMNKIFQREISKIDNVDISDYLLDLLTNKNGYKFYINRDEKDLEEKTYEIYEDNVRTFGEYLILKGGKFIEVDISSYDVSKEYDVKKILEKYLLV